MDIADIDLAVPSSARMYDYMLGGTDNFEVDRVAAEAILEKFPDARADAIANRGWVRRIVRTAISKGITQFLDIGSGLPTVDNVHQVAQRYAPDARVAYTDNNPMVVAHGRHLLADAAQARYGDADARDFKTVLADAAELLDFDQPIIVMMASLLQHIPTGDDPSGLVANYVAALPPGSLLAISHPAGSDADQKMFDLATVVHDGIVTLRGANSIEGLFGGLRLLEPGLVDVQLWRPEREGPSSSFLGGLAQV